MTKNDPPPSYDQLFGQDVPPPKYEDIFGGDGQGSSPSQNANQPIAIEIPASSQNRVRYIFYHTETKILRIDSPLKIKPVINGFGLSLGLSLLLYWPLCSRFYPFSLDLFFVIINFFRL